MQFSPIHLDPVTGDDRQKFGDNANEGDNHIWGKRGVYRGCSNNNEIDVVTEEYLGTHRPDCLIEAPIPSSTKPNQVNTVSLFDNLTQDSACPSENASFIMQGRAVEIVTNSRQNFVRKIRNNLRCGHVSHWVFIEGSEKIADARQELDPYLTEEVTFGRYDPSSGYLSLGDAISFRNFDFIVSDLYEFIPSHLEGQGWGLHWDNSIGYNVGEFSFDGDRRRVYSHSDSGRGMRSHPPNDFQEPGRFADEKYTLRDVHHLLKDGTIKRIGPTAGYRSKRYRNEGSVSNAYLAPRKVNRICYEFHHLANA